jgi:hypothetical protein
MRLPIVIFLLGMAFTAIGQKRLSEGNMTFSVITTTAGNAVGDTLVALHYFKGAHIRTDLIGSIGRTTTIYDTRETTGAIIRDFGSQKILIPLDDTAWTDRNSWYANAKISYKDDEKILLGYSCKRANIQLDGGAVLEVFFTTEVKLDNSDTEFQMENLPGLVLSYTYTKDQKTVAYIAESLNFDPVPIQRFDIPSSGYRILSYAESKKQF